MLVRWQLERPMYDFKNSFSLDFVYIYRAKYIFPETYIAFTISDPDFTVWDKNSEWSALDFRIISKLDSSFLLAVLSELLKFQL